MSAKPAPDQQKTICGLKQTTKLVEKGDGLAWDTGTEWLGMRLSTYLRYHRQRFGIKLKKESFKV